MKKIKILFLLLICFLSIFSYETKAENFYEAELRKIDSDINLLKETLKKNQDDFYIRVDDFIEKIKDDTKKIIDLNQKINAIKIKLDNYEEKSLITLKTRLQYFNKKIEKEIYEKILIPSASKHLQTPESVKSLYYTSYAASSDSYLNTLYSFVENTEINSVTIDIKEVDGYVAFDMSEYDFDTIKPQTNGLIKDPKGLIEELHKKGIYTIARIVVFKDNRLTNARPDLAIKKGNAKEVWEDYKGNSYLDAGSKEVWDYIVNLASTAYEIGFDEINFDYIRFPSDGPISDSYYPHSQKVINTNGNYGKIMVIENFSQFITEKLKEKYPNIVLSADIFGLVTNHNLYAIGQNLESFLVHFDYVCPMTYPSHYSYNYLGLGVPDEHPYEILKNALETSYKKIDTFNQEIKTAQAEQRKVKINNAFEIEKNPQDIAEIKNEKMRLWIQGFTCTRCSNTTAYTREKFRKQIQAIYDAGGNSFFVWNSASRYYFDWYNKE